MTKDGDYGLRILQVGFEMIKSRLAEWVSATNHRSVKMYDRSILARILDEVRSAEAHAAATTAHNVYVSGVFEDTETPSNSKSVLSKVLEEVRAADAHAASTTAHNTYVSGVFEETDKG